MTTSAHCKEKGNQIAWAESWPTVFALVAQRYYVANGVLDNEIMSVGDDKYTAYNRYDTDLAYANATLGEKLGEACEGTVMIALYALVNDVGLSHPSFWNATTRSTESGVTKAKTLSDFMQYYKTLVGATSEKYSDTCTILSGLNLAPKVTASGVFLSATPPSFSWVYTNGSAYFNSVSYQLRFYNQKRTLIVEFAKASGVALSSLEWDSIFNTLGSYFYLSVEVKESTGAIETQYSSEWKIFEKLLTINPTINPSDHYYEQMVFCSHTDPGEVYIKFATTGVKKLLLAGSWDIAMNVYNSSGYIESWGYAGSYGVTINVSSTTEVYKVVFIGYDEPARFIVLNSPDSSYYPQWFDTFPVNYTFYGGQTEMMQSAMLYPSVYGLYQMELTNFGTNGAVYIFSMNDPEKEFVCANLSHRGGNYLNAYEEYLLVFYAYKNAPAFSTTLKIVKV